ncbi:hypothetical protein GCM10025886_00580 [Tetragenococcus halophilus subsp. flandriensis]|uniref:hypothetical protein n=1 Tax=Tetragenococcus halophilus TaxID=51669 RepID=UPI0023E9C492|nr:hypothetical protein [Tetragenococcus halophilus]GMA06907.1 hypothetical protein GCM10025886_00580 [Tetragenococcus halophilus subsp. flandriensis]
MKTGKLVIGIFSIVLSVIIGFQSMIAGLGNTLSENGEAGGSGGLILGILMLVAGIVSIVQRSHRGNAPVIMFVIGGLLGLILAGSYADLNIWSTVSLVFGAIILIFNIRSKKIAQQ